MVYCGLEIKLNDFNFDSQNETRYKSMCTGAHIFVCLMSCETRIWDSSHLFAKHSKRLRPVGIVSSKLK